MNWYKKIGILLLTACCSLVAAYPQTSFQPAAQERPAPDSFPPTAPNYWQQELNYTIDVSLNDTEHTLDGFVRILYTNHSPDTLSFIWIHLWPNAYKNDQTAFSEQLLENGRTDFYFSDKDKKGYINHLDFRVDGALAKMEDHPRYIDVIKIILPHPLLPGSGITITTPFHEQLPFPFSRSGYDKGLYQVTQWYPQPAVYDSKGWHEMPYLDQGACYGEYGDFDVRITLPENYTVAATGELSSPDTGTPSRETDSLSATTHSGMQQSTISSQRKTSSSRTIRYRQKNTPGFAWFAGRSLRTEEDTLQLASGRVIQVYAYAISEPGQPQQNSLPYIKAAVRFRSSLTGEYPYATISTLIPSHITGAALDLAIEQRIGRNWFGTVTGANERAHPWMSEGINAYYDRRYAALKYPHGLPDPVLRSPGTVPPLSRNAPHTVSRSRSTTSRNTTSRSTTSRSTTSRDSASSDSTSSDLTSRTTASRSHQPNTHHPVPHPITPVPHYPAHRHPLPGWLKKKLPEDPDRLLINTLAKEKEDQPVSTAAEDLTALNYRLIAQSKTALWMQQLEEYLGTGLFDSCMQEYFRRWSFRHPYPEDFRAAMENTSHHDLSAAFALLDKKGPAAPRIASSVALPASLSSSLTASRAYPQAPSPRREIRPTFLFSARNTDKISYINIGPALGYNTYDHLMIGALVHNFDAPPNAFQFLLAPVYATNSRRLNGAGYVGYSWFPEGRFQKVALGLEGAKFSSLSGSDSNRHQLFGGFYKIAPSLRLTLKNRSARSTMQKWIEWKTYLIGEKGLDAYVQKSTDSLFYPGAIGKYRFRYLNQLSANIEDNRVLYPYKALLQVQQGDRFYRINFTGNYFFNYVAGGGLDLRFFAAKFGYIGGRSSSLDLSIYQPKLTGVSGSEDYTYSNYFVGRNEYTGTASRQIMIRDGGLKIRVPSFPWLEGRSDNWVSSLNLSSSLPYSIVPRWLPLKAFLDIGTYADAWQDNPQTSRFLYTAGLQLSLFHNILTIYAPLLYSSDFRDQLKTVPDQNTFMKRLSFSIELQNVFRHSPGRRAATGFNQPSIPTLPDPNHTTSLNYASGTGYTPF